MDRLRERERAAAANLVREDLGIRAADDGVGLVEAGLVEQHVRDGTVASACPAIRAGTGAPRQTKLKPRGSRHKRSAAAVARPRLLVRLPPAALEERAARVLALALEEL